MAHFSLDLSLSFSADLLLSVSSVCLCVCLKVSVYVSSSINSVRRKKSNSSPKNLICLPLLLVGRIDGDAGTLVFGIATVLLPLLLLLQLAVCHLLMGFSHESEETHNNVR